MDKGLGFPISIGPAAHIEELRIDLASVVRLSDRFWEIHLKVRSHIDGSSFWVAVGISEIEVDVIDLEETRGEEVGFPRVYKAKGIRQRPTEASPRRAKVVLNS